MGKVKLLGSWSSPYSCRVEIALKLKGVEYEFIQEDLTNKSPLLLQHNPIHKKVPVLVHDGRAIVESSVILEYIDENFDGPALLPEDPYQRSKARFWIKVLDDKFENTMQRSSASSGEEQEKDKEELLSVLKFLDDELDGKKFFGGETVGLVDAAAVKLSYWFPLLCELFGVEILKEDTFPHLCKWIDEYNRCSFVKETVPPKDKLIDYIKAWLNANNASK